LEVIISAVQLRVAIRIGWAFWMATGYPNESDEKLLQTSFRRHLMQCSEVSFFTCLPNVVYIDLICIGGIGTEQKPIDSST
jgi:hypothetical protein